MRTKNITGNRYGKLVVLTLGPKNGNRVTWYCQCDCGKEVLVLRYQLTAGRTKSCGCLRRVGYHIKHMDTANYGATKEYNTWLHIKARCSNPKHPKYYLYGARGISVCNEWKNDFSAFLAYVGRRPSDKNSLDRYPNNDGNYEPGNVRWATHSEQMKNRRPFKRNRKKKIISSSA